MNNALTVYSDKRSVKAGTLISIAEDAELALRFLQLGGYAFFRYQDEVPKKGLTNPLNCSLLVVGVGHCGDKMREQFDGYVAVRDNQQIQKTLNGYQLPWFELYSSRFRYEKDVVRKPKRESQMIDKYSPKQLKAVKAAKTRYIFYNPSRRKMCGEFMTELATVLAAHVRGVLVEHIR